MSPLLSRVLSVVLLLAWGLVFGGLVAVFLAVTTVFAQLNPDQTDAGRAAAGKVAAAVFGRFEPLMLLAGALALAAAGGLAFLLKRRAAFAATALLAAGLVLAGISSFVVSPRINELRRAQQTHTAEFKSLHGKSMLLYVGIASLTALTGLLLPAAVSPPTKPPH